MRYRRPDKIAALEAANQARAVLGLEPVDKLYPGLRGMARACAITATVLDDDVDTTKWIISTSSGINIYSIPTVDLDYSIPSFYYSIPLSRQAIKFILAFDRGEFRDLTLGVDELTPNLQENMGKEAI